MSVAQARALPVVMGWNSIWVQSETKSASSLNHSLVEERPVRKEDRVNVAEVFLAQCDKSALQKCH